MNHEQLIRELLKLIGEDPTREGLLETPARYLKTLEHWTSGYRQDPAEILKVFEEDFQQYDELVLQGGISLWSTCEHHLVPFFGVAHIGYLPNGKIVGLSKLIRLVDVFARRLQVQERLTRQIAEALDDHLQPRGVGVVIRCRHTCIESRGVQRAGSMTYTSALLGEFRDNLAIREEFMGFVSRADATETNR